MANSKISGLNAGAPAQSTDLVAIARSGANFSLKLSDIAALFSLVVPSTGLRLQVGTATGTGTNQAVTFPVAFSSGTPVVVIGPQVAAAYVHGPPTTSGFALDYTVTSQVVQWIAIGNA